MRSVVRSSAVRLARSSAVLLPARLAAPWWAALSVRRPARCSVRNCRHGRVVIIGTTTVAGYVTVTAVTTESCAVTATEILVMKRGGLAAAQLKRHAGGTSSRVGL